MGGRMGNDPARGDELVLVDGMDREVGTATKERAHTAGLLHRAFSVVLVRPSARGGEVAGKAPLGCGRGEGQSALEAREGTDSFELLLARRAAGKYHSGGLWANSCCSHPRAGEELMDAAYRRVREELGCEAVDLREVSAFAYRAVFDDGLCEYEYDHVLLGRCEGGLDPDPAEVGEVRWVGLGELAAALAERPEVFAAWAPMVLTLAMGKIVSERETAPCLPRSSG